jgi:hypothetical protein
MPAAHLRRLPVLARDLLLGWVSEPILDVSGEAVVCLEVEAVSGLRYFLPMAAAEIDAGLVRIASPLHLMDDGEFYRRNGAALDGSTVWIDPASGKVLAGS